jgi:glycosyltransferase involved in cell wall biosynthesis
MLKVAHIQFSVESGGRAALRIQRAMAALQVQSNIVSLMPSVHKIENITFLTKWQRLYTRIDNKLQGYLTRSIDKQLGSFSYPLLGLNIAKQPDVQNADVIYIHWALNGMLNFKSIKQIASLKKPVIIFLHDMWAITGGCHHSFSCDKYKVNGCSQCPMFAGNEKNDLSTREFAKKIKLYNKFKNLHFIAPSKWLYNCAAESLLTKNKSVHYIPNILDDNFYKQVNKSEAKKILNIDADQTVIAFGAIAINSPYKGWAYLQKALELLYEKKGSDNITVLIFGSVYNKEVADAIPFKTKFMGYLKDEYSTTLVYNAADVFIAPSLAEAFGYVVMESLSCGTPVVGFNVGGIPDMIEHKKNGYLAKYKDAADITEGILFCLQNNIKGYLPAEILPASTIQKHIALIEKIKVTA